MTSFISSPKIWFSRHWFIALALAIVAGDLSSVYLGGWSDAKIIEAALLFDFVVVIPLLYWWCYRSKGRVAIVQAVALACFAIWATGKVVHVEHQNLLDSVSWLRYVGIAGGPAARQRGDPHRGEVGVVRRECDRGRRVGGVWRDCAAAKAARATAAAAAPLWGGAAACLLRRGAGRFLPLAGAAALGALCGGDDDRAGREPLLLQ